MKLNSHSTPQNRFIVQSLQKVHCFTKSQIFQICIPRLSVHSSPYIFKATIIEPPEWNHHTIQQLINHPLGSFYRISLAFPTPFDIWPPSVSIRLTLFTLTVVTQAQWLWSRPGRGRREIQLPLESTTPLRWLTRLPHRLAIIGDRRRFIDIFSEWFYPKSSASLLLRGTEPGNLFPLGGGATAIRCVMGAKVENISRSLNVTSINYCFLLRWERGKNSRVKIFPRCRQGVRVWLWLLLTANRTITISNPIKHSPGVGVTAKRLDNRPTDRPSIAHNFPFKFTSIQCLINLLPDVFSFPLRG